MTMHVEFRECDFFNLWIWLRFETVPSSLEQQYIDEVFSSWFFLGKLGGFNAENLQVQASPEWKPMGHGTPRSPIRT